MESIDLTNARPTARTGSRSKNSSGETGGAAPPDLLPEQLLASLWQKRAARQQRFKTNGGRQVRVLYPGRPSSSAGPDFRDAVFHLEGLGLVRGAVEIHRRQQDWDSHGHGRDPNFNGVVLHVALEVAGGDTRLQSGQQVPVISLASLLDSTGTATDSPTGTPAGDAIRSDAGPGEAFSLWALLQEKGYPRPPDGEGMVGLLDRAGDARFRQKSARYQAFLREPEPDQTLYEGICRSPGIPAQPAAFLEVGPA